MQAGLFAGERPRHRRNASDPEMNDATSGTLERKLSRTAPIYACALRCFFLLSAAASCAAAAIHAARAEQVGSASGLPIPRYVSLKSDRVNLREGPSKDHRTIWIFQRAGLPVEITAEFEIWRKVRDSEGAEGWVLHSLLSGRRTALVAPWKKGIDAALHDKANAESSLIAKLQPNVIANVRGCDGAWCKVSVEGFSGYIQQSNLWGVYPNEKIE
jgi:SH3-like domain-containing protein